MGLPKLNTPIYELVLPSTEEKIKYRPFLVKEQKLLLLAQEGKKKKEMLDSMSQILNNCTFGKINAIESYVFDVEYVFLQIRRKSVGDKITLNLLCDDDGTTRVPTEIDLGEIKVEVGENHANKISLTEKINVIMKYPTMETMDKMELLAKESTTDESSSFDIIKYCIHQVIDGDKVYERADMSDIDLTEFIESMTADNIEHILQFFETMPKVRYKTTITNPNTNVENTINIEGIDSFF
jgi:hypothetical protein